ncbi:ABC transporter substrate-binding protein [Parapusillimonas granuli]|uniref:ABC transporter substrate-binding protein n=1 Tax=Parapusillimonas granuli TaxID=380911 RepID=UPI0017FE1FA6|nr:iron(III) transport system substrate-binding protein [Parapusillimonas granuli]MEB2399648.1 ABC transporter substrate-binding protein [Alcaligenaceae bacterium]
MRDSKRIQANKALFAASTLAAALLLAGYGSAAHAASGAQAAASNGSTGLGIADAEYSLDKLIEAAKKEPPITVVDATGKIKVMAEKFSEKYGIKATGEKISASNQEEILVREAQARNVRRDVFNMSNLPNVTAQFLPQGIAVSWMPPDLKGETPAEYQHPAITSLNVWVWVYNPAVFGDKCPVDNMWALTDQKWKGKISIPDPLLRNETMFWFNQIADNSDATMKKAYEAYFGKPLESKEPTAMAEWVKRFASNKVKVQKSDTDVGPIVGASTAEHPVIGFVSAAIFSHAKHENFPMAVCKEMTPWVGQLTPRVAVIAAGTKSPNAAKLFVHYMMSAEGMLPQMEDGKVSTNRNAKMPESDASGVGKLTEKMYVNNSDTTPDDFKKLQYWRDLWTVSSR